MDLNNISKKLKEYSGARIAEKELREYVSIPDYNDYYKVVIELVNNSSISPVKSSGSNGMCPPLHKRYTIIKPEYEYDELIPEIRLLQGKLNIEGYLADLEKYKIHRSWILQLDHFLKNNAKSLEIPLSVNERSFQIFNKEKAIKEDTKLIAVLNFNSGLREALNYYNTPEPFFIYNINPLETSAKNDLSANMQLAVLPKKQQLNILIVENKDTWYTLRSQLYHGHNCIAGIPFDSLIYGEGKKISRKIDSLTEFDKSIFKDTNTVYYYFGDLDYEGIGIVHDLIAANSTLQIRLMLPLYIAMLEASKNSELPVMKEKQSKKALEWFTSLFDSGHESIIIDILGSGRYIPQEILNNSDFIRMVNDNQDVRKENV